MIKSRPKKVPQSARLSAGGRVLLFGQCPHRGGTLLKGASLNSCSQPTLQPLHMTLAFALVSSLFSLSVSLSTSVSMYASAILPVTTGGTSAVCQLNSGLFLPAFTHSLTHP